MNRPTDLLSFSPAPWIATLGSRSQHSCAACSLARICLPGSSPPAELEAIDELTRRKRRVVEGTVLCRAAEPFNLLFIVRSGVLKSLCVSGGRQRITAFHLPGDIVGLEAIDTGQYAQNVVAIEDAEICLVAFVELRQAMENSPGLQRRLLQIVSAQLLSAQRLTLLLGSMNAEQRIAAFLLMLSKRYEHMGYAPSRFILRMRQSEIGSYLGLTYETVSRAFARLRRLDLIAIDRRHWKYPEIELRNLGALQDLVGPDIQ